jgi:glycosyltransferase involved in cell wall biosynthesis
MTEPAVRISVVVPTCNRAARMERLLGALAAQDLDEPFEVVVVDDASTDDTVARLESFLTTLDLPVTLLTSAANTGPAGARNRGWLAAGGDLIAFTDDDCVPDPGWLRTLAATLDEADIVIGRTRPPDDQLERIGPFSNYLDLEHNQSFSTCNVAYRREVLEKLDGFDEIAFRWPNGEDTDLGLRALTAGFRDQYTEGALVWHDVGASDFRRHLRRVRRLDGIVTLVARHPEARQMIGAGRFLRSVDKAVLVTWAAGAALAAKPRSKVTRAGALLAGLVYVWQFRRCHYRARSATELVVSIPLGYVADSWTVVVMARSSLRHGTVLL